MDIVVGAAEPRESAVTEGRESGFDAFYATRYRESLRLATLLVRDQDRADEIVQEAFIQALSRWARVSRYDRPELWLRRVVVNKSISTQRRARSESNAIARIASAERTHASTSTAAFDIGVWIHVGRLPARQAQALALVYGCDTSIDDAAAVMQCSPGSVKTHLSRGRAHLAEVLQERP